MELKHTISINRTIAWMLGALWVICLLTSCFFFYYDNLGLGIVLLIVPFLLIFVNYILMRPVIGVFCLLVANYFAIGLTRYIPAPLGLIVDGLLILTWIAVFFSQFNKIVEWKRIFNLLTLLASIWFLYAILQLANPEAVSRIAWFYAMRGVALYMFLIVPLVFLIFNKPEHLKIFIKFWAWFTIIAVFKGVMQKFIGVDPWEDHWLDIIGGKTHRLSQGLRIFSFFSDAATYGGAMGFSGVVFSILGIHTKRTRQKMFFMIVAAMAFYGMLISGTRGAIAVPFAGFAIYMILNKRIKVIIIGAILLAGVFSFLKFTTIGDSVYEVRRFRDALDPNNASLQVRKDNQENLKEYLSSRPFGGGIGSAGNWGLRFSPDTFLANTPTDSWYVQIWAEQGIIGLMLHLSILLAILLKSCHIILFRLKNEKYRYTSIAFISGMVGIMAASYGSGALGQMPNGIIIYVSIAFIFMMKDWDKKNAPSVEA